MLPKSSKSWHFCNIYESAKIGEQCKIGSYVEIGDNVEIGNNCYIESYSFLPAGVKLENDVFIGPRVTFTNDKYPPSGGKHWKTTLVKQHARIGAGAVICPGITIGVSAIVGAGALVTKDVEDHAIVMNGAYAIRKGTHLSRKDI